MSTWTQIKKKCWENGIGKMIFFKFLCNENFSFLIDFLSNLCHLAFRANIIAFVLICPKIITFKLKVSKSRKQILKFSLEPKTNENIFVFLP